jgi:hypothetical protein
VASKQGTEHETHLTWACFVLSVKGDQEQKRWELLCSKRAPSKNHTDAILSSVCDKGCRARKRGWFPYSKRGAEDKRSVFVLGICDCVKENLRRGKDLAMSTKSGAAKGDGKVLPSSSHLLATNGNWFLSYLVSMTRDTKQKKRDVRFF